MQVDALTRRNGKKMNKKMIRKYSFTIFYHFLTISRRQATKHATKEQKANDSNRRNNHTDELAANRQGIDIDNQRGRMQNGAGGV